MKNIFFPIALAALVLTFLNCSKSSDPAPSSNPSEWPKNPLTVSTHPLKSYQYLQDSFVYDNTGRVSYEYAGDKFRFTYSKNLIKIYYQYYYSGSNSYGNEQLYTIHSIGDNGLPKVSKYINGSDSITTKYFFDNQGKLLYSKHYHYTTGVNYLPDSTAFGYDASGANVVKITNYDAYKKFNSKSVFSYDTKTNPYSGLFARFASFDNQIFLSKNNVTQEVKSYSFTSTQVTNILTYQYNTDGLPTQMIFYDVLDNLTLPPKKFSYY